MYFPPYVWISIKNFLFQEYWTIKYDKVVRRLPRYQNYATKREGAYYYPHRWLREYNNYLLTYPKTNIIREYKRFRPFKKIRLLKVYAVYNAQWQRDWRRERRTQKQPRGFHFHGMEPTPRKNI